MNQTLVTGGSGLLGPYLVEAVRALGPVVTVGRHSGDYQCDMTDPGAVRDLIARVKPRKVVHCAAMTDVDQCEGRPEMAERQNCYAVANVVEAMDGNGGLVLISTDQVYPDEPGPQCEGMENPVNVYGRTKLAGEREALQHSESLILRVNFFGASRTQGRLSLSDWLINNLRSEQEITLFSDSYFSPLHLSTLADTIVASMTKGLSGVFNLGSREGASKADFCLSVAQRLGLSTHKAKTGPSLDMQGRAPRPLDLRMDVSKIEEALAIRMPSLDEEIAKL